MGKILRLLLFACMLISTSSVFAQKTITIKGKVKFPYNRFNMEIVERQGFDKTIIDSCKVKDDGTYEFKMKVDKPGVYTLDCQKWQSVQFWAEDEDLEINFRGEDTAKIKIKNPPYVYINGGPNNEDAGRASSGRGAGHCGGPRPVPVRHHHFRRPRAGL